MPSHVFWRDDWPGQCERERNYLDSLDSLNDGMAMRTVFRLSLSTSTPSLISICARQYQDQNCQVPAWTTNLNIISPVASLEQPVANSRREFVTRRDSKERGR